jgi:hypothetical protein
MSWIGRRRLVRNWGPRIERALRHDAPQRIPRAPTTAETDPNLCPASGTEPFWAQARRGECPACFRSVELLPNPDGGPGSVLAPHARTEP